MNIKKKLLAALLSMALVITMMPQAAFAADSSVTILIGGKTLDAVNCYYVNGEDGKPGTVTGVEPAGGAWNAHYDSSTKTLCLKNLTLTKNADGSDPYSSNYCININVGADFTIDLTGTNTLSAKALYTLCVINDTTNGSNLTVQGTGSLTATQNGTTGESAVYLKNIRLTMKNGSLTGITNAMGAWACGINFDNGTLTVNGGSITGEANGDSTDGGRYGIGFGESVDSSVTINGGSLYAKSDSAGGLFANSLTMTGGTLLATSQGSALSQSPNLSGYKADPTNATSDLGYVAVYSSAADGSNPAATEAYTYDQSHKYLKIAPAVLIIAGKKMAAGCYYINGTEGVPGTVTATEPTTGWNAHYDGLSGILYLKELNISDYRINDTSTNPAAISVKGDITIDLQGASDISVKGSSYSDQTDPLNALSVSGDLTVQGSGSLLATGKICGNVKAISVGGDLYVSAGRLTGITGTDDVSTGTGLYVGGSLIVSGTGCVIGKIENQETINCCGIQVMDSITLSDSGEITGIAETTQSTGTGIECKAVTVSGGVLTASVKNGTGLLMTGSAATLNSGTLQSTAKDSGLGMCFNTGGRLTVNGGTLLLQGPYNAMEHEGDQLGTIDLSGYTAPHTQLCTSLSPALYPTLTAVPDNPFGYSYISVKPDSAPFIPYTPAVDKAAADAQSLIDAIGAVTPDKADEIQAARSAYDKLTDAQKQQVKNYQTLTEAEAALKALADQAAQEAEKEKATLKQRIKDMDLTARSRLITLKNGKKAVRIIWYEEKNGKLIKVNLDFDGVEIFRSENRYSGYGKTPIFTTTNGSYLNTAIEPNHTYYYKLRAYVLVDGKKVYTADSKKAMRTIK